MGPYIANQMVQLMKRRCIKPVGARILVPGLAFKEICPELRNTHQRTVRLD
jgi:UDP-N-acetyl-D-galactosamine dehydrogenase